MVGIFKGSHKSFDKNVLLNGTVSRDVQHFFLITNGPHLKRFCKMFRSLVKYFEQKNGQISRETVPLKNYIWAPYEQA